MSKLKKILISESSFKFVLSSGCRQARTVFESHKSACAVYKRSKCFCQVYKRSKCLWFLNVKDFNSF